MTVETQLTKILAYARQFNSIDMPYIHKIVEDWKLAKALWLEAWGGPIKDCGPITVHLTKEEKEQNFKDFLKYVDSYPDLISFLESQGAEAFYENKTRTQYQNIQTGSKIIKNFRKFINFEKELRMLQDKASLLIQNNKISGNLYLSVHPLDFLSISENTYNWHTCHSLDGDFCVGNLNYMLDFSTIVAYVSDGKKRKLPHFDPEIPWNSKKWRMLLYSKMPELTLVFAGRQYPFFSNALLELTRFKYLSSFHLNEIKYSEWSDKRVSDPAISRWQLYSPYVLINSALYPVYGLVENCNHFLGYNDVLSSVYYTAHYFYKMTYSFNGLPIDRYQIKVGCPAPCPYCGQPILYQGAFCCEKCYHRVTKKSIEGKEITYGGKRL